MHKLAAVRFLTILTAAGALAACSSTQTTATPTTADKMRGYAADQQEEVERKNAIAKQWDDGQQLVESGREELEKGQAKVEAAEKELREGNEQMARGRQQIEEGNRLTQGALQQFNEDYPGLELSSEM